MTDLSEVDGEYFENARKTSIVWFFPKSCLSYNLTCSARSLLVVIGIL